MSEPLPNNPTGPTSRVQAQPYSAFRLFQMALVGLGTAAIAIQASLAVAIAAPIAWAMLLAVLLTSDRRAEVQHRRVMVCLDTAAAGIVVLLAGVVIDGVTWPWLLASQVVMAVAFLTRWRRLGLSPAWAAAAWFGVLDGVYLIVWGVLFMGGVQ
ncbi:MAG: hypothetical protein AAGB29_15200 [Planctomycetota bacterium]